MPFRQRSWMINIGAFDFGPHIGWKSIIAGSIAGLDVCITYPTEFVKTHLQLDEKGDRKIFDGIIDCVKKTASTQGICGLYHGLSILFWGSVPKNALRFGSLEFFRDHMVDTKGRLTNLEKVLSGLITGISEAIVVVTAMETIKTELISDQRRLNPMFKGFMDCVKTVIKTDGFSGIYKGLTPTVLKHGISQAFRFFIIESLKDHYTGNDRTKPIPTVFVGLFGILAGAASTIVTNPIDVIKTRMQSLEAARFKNTIDCWVQVLRNEGVLAYYKGLVPATIRSSLDVAFGFMVYDSLMEVFNKVWVD